MPWTVGRAHRRLEPRRGRDGAAGRRRGRGGRAGLRVGAAHPARRRLVADEDRGRRGRGRQRRDQHVRLPRGRRLAPLAGPPRPRVRRRLLAGRPTRPRLRRRACSCRSAGSPGRRSGTTADRQVNGEALLAGSLEHLPGAARRASRSPSCSDDPQPEWELAGGRLGHALREHRDLFLDKSTFSMDWYYPVLGGAVRGDAGARAARRAGGTTSWCPGSASAASTPTRGSPGAETCELVLALDALGDRDRALRLLADMQHLRDDGRRLLDRLRLRPTSVELARRAHDLHRGRGDPGRRRALG